MTRPATLEQITARALTFWRPPPRLKLSEWADRYFYLSAESAAEPGKWHTLPYQREPMDCITDPAVEWVTMMKSSRVGYTKMIDATAGYYIHQDPCPVMIVQPTLDAAEGFSKEEIAPMLRDCEVLAELIAAPSSKDSNNTILRKLFPGGSLTMVGANSARGFRRVSRKVVLFDEVDGYPASAGTEGDQIKLGVQRTLYYWDRKLVAGSTPVFAGGRIEKLFLQGDQRRYHVPCPHCDHEQVLQWARMSWPKGKPREAVYLCEECGAAIEYAHQRDMVHAGRWIAAAPFNGHASFHIWAAYSFAPNATWGQLAEEWIEAEAGGNETLQTFVNTVLGEGWQLRGEAPEWERLYERREGYAIGTVPKGAAFLTAGVDVQKGRVVVEVVAWGPGKESWSIDAFEIPCNTDLVKGTDGEDGLAEALDPLLNRAFLAEDGRELHIRMLAIDSGFNTLTVVAWCRGHPMNRVIAVRGRDSLPTLVGAAAAIDVTTRGKRRKRGYRYYPVGVNIVKSELYGWLQLAAPTRESGDPYPPGFCHHPQHGEDYFKQITAEKVVPIRKKTGFVTFEWHLIPGRQNHYLDCRVYARAAAALLGMDRWRDADWQALMGAPDTPPTKPKPAPAKPGDPAAAAQERVERQAQRESFLGSRGRGYWDRRR